MDRALALLGSLFAAAVVALGVARTADSQVPAAPPAGPAAPPAPAAAPPYASGAPPAGVGDVLRAYGRPPARMVVPEGSRALEWPALAAYEHRPGLEGLPDSIKALEGQTVTMRGFLMPLYEFDDIHEFVLVANHMSCCFGMPAGISGQVQVKMPPTRRACRTRASRSASRGRSASSRRRSRATSSRSSASTTPP